MTSIRDVTPAGGRVAVVGAGASALVGELATAGYAVLAVDVSAVAIDKLRRSVEDAIGSKVRGVDGARGGVEYVVADTCTLRLDAGVDTWHDRAVFHFLTEPDDQCRYVDAARSAVVDDGHLVIATFAPDGPDRCSGLPVVGYDDQTLAATFADGFSLIRADVVDHRTPDGRIQRFTHAVLRRSIAAL